MRRYLLCAAMGIVVFGLAWAGWQMSGPSALAVTYQKFQAQGLEKKFCGGWLFEAVLGDSTVKVLNTFAGDGGLVMNCTTRADDLFNVTGVGSWKATGPQTVSSMALLFIQDFKGNLVMYEKVGNTSTLSDDGNRMEGSSVIYMYWADQDPLDPEEVPFVTVPVPGVVGRRIAIE